MYVTRLRGQVPHIIHANSEFASIGSNVTRPACGDIPTKPPCLIGMDSVMIDDRPGVGQESD